MRGTLQQKKKKKKKLHSLSPGKTILEALLRGKKFSKMSSPPPWIINGRPLMEYFSFSFCIVEFGEYTVLVKSFAHLNGDFFLASLEEIGKL